MLAVALVVLPLMAVMALALRPTPWTRPAVAALAGCAGFAAWSAMSVRWAIAPDLAWLSANRALLACAALLAGIGIGRALRSAPQLFAAALAIGAGIVMAVALLMRVVPDLGPAGDTVRLAAPVGYANALALIAVFALPGATVLLARGGRHGAAGAAIVALLVATLALSQSRSGVLALLVAAVIVLWWQPGRADTLAAIGLSLAALAPAVVYAATAAGLTGNQILGPASTRRVPGLVLGGLLAAGIAVVILATPAVAPILRQIDRRTGRRGRIAAAGAGAGLALAGAVLLALSDRFAGVAGIGRLVSTDSNRRTEWWGEAWRGFRESPIVGHGAGSFPLTHLQERLGAVEILQVRQPHQIGLEALSETGLVGLVLGLLGIAGVGFAVRRLGPPAAPAAAILAAFLVQAQFDWTWTIPATSLPALAAAGVLVGTPTGATLRARTTSRWALWSVPIALAVAVSGLVAWWGTDRALRADDARASGDRVGALRLAREAEDANPLAIHGQLIAAQVLYEADRTTEAARKAAQATQRQPDNPIAWECLLLVGNGPQQRIAMERIRALNPASGQALHDPRCRGAW